MPRSPHPFCPHCLAKFRTWLELDGHLRDQGDAPRLCPVLRR